jgi:hypothetical protein
MLMTDIPMESSSSVLGTLIGVVIVWAISAGITGMLAARKNRSVVAWAILGGIIFPVTGLLILLFMSHLCPKCHRPISPEEAERKKCPRCRTLD